MMMAADKLAMALLCGGTGLYVAAGILLVANARRMGFVAFGAAWVLNALLFAFNWLACGEPPLGNMYHVLTLLGLCFLPAYLVLALRDRLRWPHAYFALISAVPLIGSLFMQHEVLWRRMPALQSPWFVPHVMAYMIAYSLATVAFAMTVAGIVREKALKRTDGPPFAEASYQTIRLAFPFMTFGMLSGALWAENAWGVYWSWDTKETWSLITWTLYAIYFHCRLRPRLRPYVKPAQLVAFLALLITFLLVNLLPRLASALHSYA